MKIYEIDSSFTLPRPVEEIFPFFANARNLELITPPWVKFHVVTPEPIVMAVGTRIQYELRLRGIRIGWESEITIWEPPRIFADEQRRGPYQVWRHEHRFTPVNRGTECVDHIEYAPMGGALTNYLFVAPDLKRIFDYRRKKLEELFGGSDTP